MNSNASSSAFLFLTGATGHTGSRTARRLLELGWRLRCLNHDPEHIKYLPVNERLEVVSGDVRHSETWCGKLRGADACIHMAHVGYAAFMLDACARAGVKRLIALSSTRRFTNFPERTARLVIAGEGAIEASQLHYTILRSNMIFGGDRDNNLERVVRWLRCHRWMPLIAGGRNQVQPIFVWDLVEAIVAALQRLEATCRKTLVVAGPEPMTQRRMIERIAEKLGRPVRWLPVPYSLAISGAWVCERLQRRPMATRDQIRRMLEDKAFDISEAREALGGWQPRSFEAALELKLAGKA